MTPSIDGPRLNQDLAELARIGATPRGGVHRIGYSAADREARALVERWLGALGCEVKVDPAGNTVARYPGSDPLLAPLAIGSHTDTVPDGGRFDGALGVVAGVALIRALQSSGLRLQHPLEIINFACEEATMSGGTLGSRAMAGDWDPAIGGQPAWDGRPVEEHLREAGLNSASIAEAKRRAGELAAYLELHIEQGGVLEAEGMQVAAVTGIVGIRRYRADFEGTANHAGTTPMALRDDALVKAAPFITDVRDLARRHGIVATVGTLQVNPGASNVIPGDVQLSCEIRATEEGVLDAAEQDLFEHAEERGGRLVLLSAKTPVASSEAIVGEIEVAATELSLRHRRLPSGAGHDAMSMAALCPVAMIFVPSRAGVSHSPAEFTSEADCSNGAKLLLATLLRLDRRDREGV